jgi:hypothetical protein
MNARELIAQALLDLQVKRDGGKPFSIREAGENTLHRHNSEADAILAAMPEIVRAMVVPLVWLPASERRLELGRMHGYSERLAYIGDESKLHWYRVYPVGEGKWRWVEQFRMTYIDGNTASEAEPCSAKEAMTAANKHRADQYMAGLGVTV